MFLLSKDECKAKHVEIISGCTDTDGLVNFQDAFYIKSFNEVQECDDKYMDVYKVRILKQDSLVKKVEE
jgi:hypothetical protein